MYQGTMYLRVRKCTRVLCTRVLCLAFGVGVREMCSHEMSTVGRLPAWGEGKRDTMLGLF